MGTKRDSHEHTARLQEPGEACIGRTGFSPRRRSAPAASRNQDFTPGTSSLTRQASAGAGARPVSCRASRGGRTPGYNRNPAWVQERS